MFNGIRLIFISLILASVLVSCATSRNTRNSTFTMDSPIPIISPTNAQVKFNAKIDVRQSLILVRVFIENIGNEDLKIEPSMISVFDENKTVLKRVTAEQSAYISSQTFSDPNRYMTLLNHKFEVVKLVSQNISPGFSVTGMVYFYSAFTLPLYVQCDLNNEQIILQFDRIKE